VTYLRSCEPAGQSADVGDKDPSDGAFDGRLEVLGQPAAAIEPSEGAFDHPTARQQYETLGGIASFDDLDGPLPHFCECFFQLVAGIAAIGEDVAQPGIQLADRSQGSNRAVSILNVGSMNPQADQIALGVGDDMAFAALDLFTGIKPTRTAAFRGLDRLAVDHAGPPEDRLFSAGQAGSLSVKMARAMPIRRPSYRLRNAVLLADTGGE